MYNELEKIKKVISHYIEISNEEWMSYSSKFQVKEIMKKEIILSQGDICRDVFFVVDGLLRVFFVDNNGEEKTFHFSFENTFSADYESFLKKIPSNYSIQALEDTTIVLMSFEMLHDGYKILANGEKLGRLLAEEYFFIFNDNIQAIYTQSPIVRYNNLIRKFPNILQRIPQHYIASYLNISSVHLSRLKNSQ
ncbi:cAMP-binding domain of CRP or a regulatory subunit of cAMP-dependent protein kinases [Flavobacterium segetis]|uniref:cAMP-binding domain of CRP or a regulatory subunit of cAMP-dependent protein kinases n=1 Tax=Flavobacterium segetis TaxID=271157 RepID=A0A1M5IUK0_9FLAO|nr:Crp/Fnr family transcriptional regulator [Flavobacterium segetis]SHG31997.1 cAMP-binding domain of CRP or a regulatory subunit of cAMP-dependent protein kinases [Flavobacterium segetis]